MGLVDTDDVAAAAARIDGYVLRTPLLDCERLSTELGCRVLVKVENLQHTGSFKPRRSRSRAGSSASRRRWPCPRRPSRPKWTTCVVMAVRSCRPRT